MHQQTQHRQNQAAQAAASMTAALQGPPKTGSHSTVYPSQHSQHSQHPQQPEHLQHPQYTQTYNHQGYPPTPPSATDASWDQVKALSCCFRTYRTLKDKEKHMQQHVRCPQCPYSAAKVLVDDHLRVEHNVADKSSKSKPDGIVPFNAPKLDTPEALNAWIQARKKNWPTKANVERKEQEKRKRQLERSDRPKQEPKEKKQKTAEDIRAIVGDYGSSSECEEEEGSKVPSSTRSDEEEDDIMDPERDAVTSKDPKAMGRVGSPPPTRPRKLCKYFMTKRGCLHGDKCTFSHERPSRPEPRQKKPPMTKSRPNLLRKLLEKEIEQERNVLLQCFRHIVDNDFFQ
ncbi:hypothetical protein BCR43DRAFT_451034 [Syncephalastrum racemosum]|uniref:C3H1-type domain-containing protein n=1 Tax=Syncephalastrum racemosum TaxID=13706 RepID=A0A1X2HVI5_SYNRA|nr:hypothetical protein BCR43DRAFT_451034 [Syncephalastrum racemosum]